MSFSFSLKSIEFNSGDKIELAEDALVVFVGPNNAGKSQTLRDVITYLERGDMSPTAVRQVDFQTLGSSQDFQTRFAPYLRHTANRSAISAPGITLNSHSLESYFVGVAPRGLTRLFCNHVTTESRLTVVQPPTSLNTLTDPPIHPLQVLYTRDDLEKTISKHFRRAFGTGLVLNRGAGASIPLHVGEEPAREDGEDRVSTSYLQSLAQLPLLHQQGDGMRSFAGTLLHVVAGGAFVVLIDEPEAFLHPPQARLMGTLLAREKLPEVQLLLATHSGDLLRGLLDANPTNLSIVRLRRDGSANRVHVLDAEGVRRVWHDPILRYSNVLDGIFHERVVLCESDSDCRFYSAILSAISSEDRTPDMMFASSGGKHRLPTVIRALKSLGVSVGAIADFDVLNAEEPLKTIVTALGGKWDDLGPLWKRIHGAIEKKVPRPNKIQVQEEVNKIIDSVPGSVLTSDAVQKIREATKSATLWDQLKDVGIRGVPAGEPTTFTKELLTKLRQIGLFVVECGQLESFVRSVGNHGPAWVSSALARDLNSDAEYEEVRNFMRVLETSLR